MKIFYIAIIALILSTNVSSAQRPKYTPEQAAMALEMHLKFMVSGIIIDKKRDDIWVVLFKEHIWKKFQEEQKKFVITGFYICSDSINKNISHLEIRGMASHKLLAKADFDEGENNILYYIIE